MLLHFVLCLVPQLCPTPCDPMDYNPPGSSVHGDSPSKNTDWAAKFSSMRSSQPRDWTQVSHIAGGFFTIWATREALAPPYSTHKYQFWHLCRIN